jgi:3-methylfumaryl-CoA hydratase
LFRFSALTYNAHRVHYDRNYATRVEGYRGLVVHGPLQSGWPNCADAAPATGD